MLELGFLRFLELGDVTLAALCPKFWTSILLPCIVDLLLGGELPAIISELLACSARQCEHFKLLLPEACLNFLVEVEPPNLEV
jgi:hypothetical protein